MNHFSCAIVIASARYLFRIHTHSIILTCHTENVNRDCSEKKRVRVIGGAKNAVPCIPYGHFSLHRLLPPSPSTLVACNLFCVIQPPISCNCSLHPFSINFYILQSFSLSLFETSSVHVAAHCPAIAIHHCSKSMNKIMRKKGEEKYSHYNT